MSLPLVLAGPILRRSDQERICIWLATSREVPVEAEVFVAKSGDSSQVTGRTTASM